MNPLEEAELSKVFEKLDALECEVDHTRVEFEHAERALQKHREQHHELFVQHAKTHLIKTTGKEEVCPVCGDSSKWVGVPQDGPWGWYFQWKLRDTYTCGKGHTYHWHKEEGYLSTLNHPKLCLLCVLDYPETFLPKYELHLHDVHPKDAAAQ